MARVQQTITAEKDVKSGEKITVTILNWTSENPPLVQLSFGEVANPYSEPANERSEK